SHSYQSSYHFPLCTQVYYILPYIAPRREADDTIARVGLREGTVAISKWLLRLPLAVGGLFCHYISERKLFMALSIYEYGAEFIIAPRLCVLGGMYENT
ncbi:hypothetical protein TNIN_96131, partial [Trichonephila inaurata madagascariensis]